MSHPTIELLGPTPRRVPLPVRCHLVFGGGIIQFGWVMLILQSVLFWLVFMNSEAITLLTFPDALKTTNGMVLRSEKTTASEGGGKHRPGIPIFANYFQFTVDGKRYTGCSYAVGQQLSEGRNVVIEYSPADPLVSRIQGMRVRIFDRILIVFPIAQILTVLLLFSGYLRSRRTKLLLECGQLAKGKLKSKEPTNARINNKRVFNLTFDFTANDGRTYQAKTRTHLPQKLEDEASEQIIYDPADPTRALLVDAMPGYFRVDEAGNIQPESSRRALLVTMVPMLTIFGNLAWGLQGFL